jgi:beta-mannosidase
MIWKILYWIPALFLCAACDRDNLPALLQEVADKPSSKQTISLDSDSSGKWSLYFGPQDENAPSNPGELKKSKFQKIPATVPGNVEIDLLSAGVIEDPMVGTHVWDLRKYETCQWWYQRTFLKPDLPQGHRIELCFNGIDCIADIWLNGRKIAVVDNMLVKHHFDVTDLLQSTNDLYVHIKSTELEARKYLRNNFGVRYDQLGEAVSIRKAPHMFGWDIMPRLLSAGIWKDVNLEIIPPTYFSSVYWITKEVYPEVRKANMYVDWQFHTDRLLIDDLTMTIELERNGKSIYRKEFPVITTVAREQIRDLENVDLWWPRGFGEAALYNATLRIADKAGTLICENKQKIGIRKTELIVTPLNTRESPGDFHFMVNGEYIFVKGTNWVPLDGLHSRDIRHVEEAVGMLADLNCNMIRMWGGNVYESDLFYELCDVNGIMVWQDFIMGCTTYPQDAGFSKRIREEAEKVIRRLRNHPSLVLWAGNNENDVSLEWGGDQPHLDPNTDVISREVLPQAVREWDPKTPYLPSSPFISEEAFAVEHKIISDYSPEMHLWGPRGYYKAPFYTENDARFVSEIGYHGCPNVESLEKMMDPEYVYPWITRAQDQGGGQENPERVNGAVSREGNDRFYWNEQWQCKATCSHPNTEVNKFRNNLMINQIKEVFGEVPMELEDFVLASQIVQAEAVKYFIEFWRMNKGDRHGILWWNLRDGWPIVSDAIVDYYGGKKRAYGYIKRVQTDVCVMIGDPRDGRHPVVAVNDTRKEVNGTVRITDAGSGHVLMSKSFSIGTNGKLDLGSLPGTAQTQMWLIECEVNGEKFKNHYFAYTPPITLEEYVQWLPLLQ